MNVFHLHRTFQGTHQEFHSSDLSVSCVFVGANRPSDTLGPNVFCNCWATSPLSPVAVSCRDSVPRTCRLTHDCMLLPRLGGRSNVRCADWSSANAATWSTTCRSSEPHGTRNVSGASDDSRVQVILELSAAYRWWHVKCESESRDQQNRHVMKTSIQLLDPRLSLHGN